MPSNVYGWRHQVTFFVNQGFVVLAPYLLGYGGTDKPTEPAFYAKSLMAADIIAIMGKEGINTKVYSIGHDWGCALSSGLANFYPDRFIGFAYLAVGYRPQNTAFTIESFYERTAALAGRETHGYWPPVYSNIWETWGTACLLSTQLPCHSAHDARVEIRSCIRSFCKARADVPGGFLGINGVCCAYVSFIITSSGPPVRSAEVYMFLNVEEEVHWMCDTRSVRVPLLE
ncbi:Alpha/Beta hydrolase protein [Mycena epipterygia]|nr:Alpha/Beta hydrolase protein [Mycena epipterygia]